MLKNAIIIKPLVDVRDDIAPLATQLLYGDLVSVLDREDNEILVKNKRDGYQGWIGKNSVSEDIFDPTHYVITQNAYVYDRPTVMVKPTSWIPFMGSVRLDLEKQENEYIYAPDIDGWIYARNVAPIANIEKDYINTAMQFLNIPYLYGGCSYRGIDCSSLVQLCLYRAGISVARDTKDQMNVIGKHVEKTDIQRGDIVFFKGHVGMMIDKINMIHANGTAMCVSTDDLDNYDQQKVNELNLTSQTSITAIKRL